MPINHPRDLMFDTWLAVQGEHLKSIVMRITTTVLKAKPKGTLKRTRRPKADQVERVGTIVSALVANLALFHSGKHKGERLAIPAGHPKAASRYDRKGFNQLRPIVDAMTEAGLVIVGIPFRDRRTGIEAYGWLLESLLDVPLRPADLGVTEGEETLWLSARTGRDGKGNKLPKAHINYVDTEETLKLREEVGEINAFLNTQTITLDGDPQGTIRLTRRFLLRSISDPHEFTLHGRIYGGFWQSLRKNKRGGLRINGESIADLDFVSMFPQLAYARVGALPPEGDLYAIPGLEAHRAGVKAGFSALLSVSSEMRKLPGEVKAALPEVWTASRFKQAIAEKHPALAPLFGRDTGSDLMFTESRILMAVLRKLMAQGIAALPMHDGIMVASSNAGLAEAAMQDASELVIGKRLPVALKT